MGKRNQVCPECGRNMKQPFIGLQHCKCGSLEMLGQTVKSQIILNADHHEGRKMIELCQTKQKRILSPIIDWTEQNTWNLLGH